MPLMVSLSHRRDLSNHERKPTRSPRACRRVTLSLSKGGLTTSGNKTTHHKREQNHSPRVETRPLTLSQSRGHPEHVQGPANFQQATVILSPDNQTFMVRSRQRDGQAHHERFVSPLTLSLSKGEQVLHTKHSCPQHVGEPTQIYTGANI